MEADNRRKRYRLSCRLPVDFTWDGKAHQAFTKDISLGGASIETQLAVPVGTRLPLRFTVPTQREPVEVGAEVRWCGAGSLGVQFEGLRARDMWAINKFFEKELARLP